MTTAHEATAVASRWRRAADAGLWVTATIGILAVVATAAMWFAGVRPVVVMSGSMEPAYPMRSVALVRAVDPTDVAVGDVLAVCRPNGQRVLHRVHTLDPGPAGPVVTLKGDANEQADVEPIVITEAYRAVGYIPHVGVAATWLRSPLAGLAAGLLLAGAAHRRRPRPGVTPQIA